jgi:hypothetical protein
MNGLLIEIPFPLPFFQRAVLPGYEDESLLEYLASMLEDYSADLDDDITG